MKKCRFILIMICLFVLVSCANTTKLFPTNNKGRYSVTFGKYESKSEDEMVTIRGHVFDIRTGKPLSDATLITGCFKFQTTPEGEYSFRTRNLKGDSFFVEAVVYPYLAVETDYINIYNKKEVIIDFYLIEDLRHLIECGGGGAHDRMQKELNNLK